MAYHGFSIPNLPLPWFTLLKQVRHAYHLSPWQCVILALQCLQDMGEREPVKVGTMVAMLKVEYPAEYR